MTAHWPLFTAWAYLHHTSCLQETERLAEKQEKLKDEVRRLRDERDHLLELVSVHASVCPRMACAKWLYTKDIGAMYTVYWRPYPSMDIETISNDKFSMPEVMRKWRRYSNVFRAHVSAHTLLCVGERWRHRMTVLMCITCYFIVLSGQLELGCSLTYVCNVQN